MMQARLGLPPCCLEAQQGSVGNCCPPWAPAASLAGMVRFPAGPPPRFGESGVPAPSSPSLLLSPSCAWVKENTLKNQVGGFTVEVEALPRLGAPTTWSC